MRVPPRAAIDDQGVSNVSAPFMTDKIVGGLVMASAIGLVAIAMLILAIASNAPPPEVGRTLPTSGPDAKTQNLINAFLILGGVIAPAHFVSGLGVYQSKKWGFIAALILGVISMAGQGASLIIGAFVAIYSIVRLWGNVGPRPRS